ncbi:hypothetical protein B0T14DRAFT_123972 [Immersiella caudata]|uniref:Uncharacterized protein n=1 Tax=Immersiella caudata TaxID=314043 RepID=A0AA39X464_9PEZI|nr:hypothetical protein B0T14DRAFT_123972 [Immersiella caudata]
MSPQRIDEKRTQQPTKRPSADALATFPVPEPTRQTPAIARAGASAPAASVLAPVIQISAQHAGSSLNRNGAIYSHRNLFSPPSHSSHLSPLYPVALQVQRTQNKVSCQTSPLPQQSGSLGPAKRLACFQNNRSPSFLSCDINLASSAQPGIPSSLPIYGSLTDLSRIPSRSSRSRVGHPLWRSLICQKCTSGAALECGSACIHMSRR